jgi:hypothetical protein
LNVKPALLHGFLPEYNAAPALGASKGYSAGRSDRFAAVNALNPTATFFEYFLDMGTIHGAFVGASGTEEKASTGIIVLYAANRMMHSFVAYYIELRAFILIAYFPFP